MKRLVPCRLKRYILLTIQDINLHHHQSFEDVVVHIRFEEEVVVDNTVAVVDKVDVADKENIVADAEVGDSKVVVDMLD